MECKRSDLRTVLCNDEQRPCGIKYQRTSQKPAGSKFLDPVAPMNMGSGPSFPAYPLAKSLSEVVVLLLLLRCTEVAGAKATAAEAKMLARMTDFIMVTASATFNFREMVVQDAVQA